MSDKTLVLLGAGGHAKVCYEIAIIMKKWENIIILDDNLENEFFNINGKLEKRDDYPKSDFFVAIGNNKLREKLLRDLIEKKYSISTLIHPKAIISPSTGIKRGTVIMAGVVINANTQIGLGSILNTSCTIDHDNIISDFVHISPGVNIAGDVKVGDRTWIGIGSKVSNNVTIQSEVIVGAGSLVIDDLLDSGIYMGIPAKKRLAFEEKG